MSSAHAIFNCRGIIELEIYVGQSNHTLKLMAGVLNWRLKIIKDLFI